MHTFFRVIWARDWFEMTWISLIALYAAGAGWLHAAPNEGNAAVVRILNDIHAVNSLDKTLAFYRDVFELNAEPQSLPNPSIAALTNAPGVKLRVAVLHLPNTSFGFELTEFSGVERKSGRANIPDPGAATLILRVRELDRVVDAAKKSGIQIVTPSSTPIRLPSTARGSRAILMRDPDGYFVEAEDVSSSSTPLLNTNVQSAGMRFAMADRDATVKFYGDLLGFTLTGGTDFTINQAMIDFTGVPKGSQARALSGTVPGTNDSIAFYEFKDLPRTPFRLRVTDPGAPAMSLQVKDLDGLLMRMRAAGVPVLSAQGKAVQFTPTIRNVLIEDPNGINIELFEAMQ